MLPLTEEIKMKNKMIGLLCAQEFNKLADADEYVLASQLYIIVSFWLEWRYSPLTEDDKLDRNVKLESIAQAVCIVAGQGSSEKAVKALITEADQILVLSESRYNLLKELPK